MARLEETRPESAGRARGLVSGRRSGARVEAGKIAVPADLDGLVEAFWWGRWDLRDQPPHVSELLASPSVNLVVEGGRGRVVGVWRKLWRRELAGVGGVRAVKLRPGRARAVLPGSAHHYTDRLVPFEEVFPDRADLPARIEAAETEEDAAARWAEFLRQVRRPVPEAQLVVAALRLAQEGTAVRVQELAEPLGVSPRHLQRIFREHLGASPKWALRRLRLQEVAARLEAGEAACLVELALGLGYSDQAHLSRDFKAATGRTLREFERVVHET